jgi:hypothetical protein
MSIDSPSIAATVTPDPHSLEKAKPEPLAHRAVVWLAWVLWALFMVTAIFAFYLTWANDPQAAVERIVESFFSYVLMGFLLVTFGALIVSYRPENPLGWIFCISGILMVIYLLAQQYTIFSLQNRSALLPGTTIAMWLATQWPTYLATSLIASFVLLLFPTGTLLSPRWRPVAWLAGGVAVVYVIIVALRPGPLELRIKGLSAYNPLGIAGTKGLFAALEVVVLIAYTLVVVASTVSVVLRFRQAQDEERQQIKWFAYAAGWLLQTLALTFAGWLLQTQGLTYPSWLMPTLEIIVTVCWIVALSGIPLAVGIAILKYRLYDIDLIINRTLVYVPLTAILAGVYTASIAVFQRLFSAITGEKSDAAVVLTTLIVAAAFTPIKNGLQGLVDKYFKENPHTTRRLDSFGEQVAEFVRMSDARQLICMLLDEMVQAFNARGGAAYLEHLGRMQLVHQSEGWRDEDAAINIHLDSEGKQFSEIKLGAKRSGQAYTARDREALQLNASRVAEAVWLAQRARWHLATGEWSSPVQRKQTESRHNQGT